MRERQSFMEEKELMNAKILELEAMNDELLSKDFEIGKLESEAKELSQTLEASLKREAEIREQLDSSVESPQEEADESQEIEHTPEDPGCHEFGIPL